MPRLWTLPGPSAAQQATLMRRDKAGESLNLIWKCQGLDRRVTLTPNLDFAVFAEAPPKLWSSSISPWSKYFTGLASQLQALIKMYTQCCDSEGNQVINCQSFKGLQVSLSLPVQTPCQGYFDFHVTVSLLPYCLLSSTRVHLLEGLYVVSLNIKTAVKI